MQLSSRKDFNGEITVVEGGSVACSASGKAGGFLALDWCDGTPLEQLARVSFKMHQEWSQKFKEADYRNLETFSFELCKKGEEEERVEGFPLFVEAGVKEVRKMGSKESTAQVDPFKLTQQLFKVSLNNGVQLHKGTATNILVSQGKVKGVEVDGEMMEADIVVCHN